MTLRGHLEEDTAEPILFFHGKESGPFGTKYTALSKEFPQLKSPDFQGLDLEERIEKAEEYTREMENILVVGSSMGGLVASLLYKRCPDRFFSLVLCAPAFHWEEAKEISTVPWGTTIVHGEKDSVVPYETSWKFASQFCPKTVRLVTTKDGHRLHNSLFEIVLAAKTLGAARSLVAKGGYELGVPPSREPW